MKPLDLRQLVKIGPAEHVLPEVRLAPPIGRIEVEQHAGAVIAPDEVGIAELLDHDADETLVDVGQQRFERGHVTSTSSSGPTASRGRSRLLDQEIKAWTGHTTDSEVARYTAAADQRTLSDTAANKLLANLAERLAKDAAKALGSRENK
jgi:hypothetical protein